MVLADANACHSDRRARLEVPDIVEPGGDRKSTVTAAELERRSRQLRGEERECREAQQNEQAGADFQGA